MVAQKERANKMGEQRATLELEKPSQASMLSPLNQGEDIA
jgi:hypothetical protein